MSISLKIILIATGDGWFLVMLSVLHVVGVIVGWCIGVVSISMVISMDSMQTVISMVWIVVEISSMWVHIVLLVRCCGILSLMMLDSVMELSLQVMEEIIV